MPTAKGVLLASLAEKFQVLHSYPISSQSRDTIHPHHLPAHHVILLLLVFQLALHPDDLLTPPGLVVHARDDLLHGQLLVQDLAGIAHVTGLGAFEALVERGGDTRGEIALGHTLRGGLDVGVDSPHLVHESVGVAPSIGVEGRVQAFEHDDACGRRDGDVVGHGVFDRVVEAGRVDGRRLRRDGFAELRHELEVRGCVEREGRAAPEHGFFGVGHLGQLLARQVVAVQGHDEGDVRT